MKKFVRQTSADSAGNGLKLNLRANAARVARTFEPGFYQLRIDAARLVVARTGNVSIALDIIEMDSGVLADTRPLWIAGPNATVGRLAAENQALVAQLLELAGQNIDGEIQLADVVPKLVGLTFDARLALATDSRTGRTYNAVAAIIMDDAA